MYAQVFRKLEWRGPIRPAVVLWKTAQRSLLLSHCASVHCSNVGVLGQGEYLLEDVRLRCRLAVLALLLAEELAGLVLLLAVVALADV